jgi:hypothetical protein
VSARNKETNYTRMPLGRSKITAQARRFSRP